MADYGSSTDLGTLTTALGDSVSSTLKSLGLEAATTWVTSKIQGISTSNVPDLIEKAATYYAYAFILRNLTDTDEGEMPTVTWYEKEAEKLLGAYAAQTATEDSEIHPYSSSKTPNSTYLKTRDPLTNIIPQDYYAIDERGLRILKRRVLNGDSGAWQPED